MNRPMLGTSIAHYQITAKLGQGGMGEVYRATDTKLGREVAIKVLPESFAQDEERLARFEREARTLAILNHPNIASIHGLEQSGSSQALLLELVPGEDLSERLKRAPLHLDETLDISKQITEALEAAHEKGIIHRDLKPGNIKITEDGKIKVLDFGLAKGLTEESDVSSTTNAYESPTITDAFTKPGTILGTAAYMAPEQARGKKVDQRADIWSFGCILYECLTGQKCFQGEDTTDILAGILRGEPNWNALPEETPLTIELILRKCLAKNRRLRLRDFGDIRVDLELIGQCESASTPRQHASNKSPEKQPTPIWAKSLIMALCLTTLITFGLWLKKDPVAAASTNPHPVRHLTIDLDENGKLFPNYESIRLSRDGSTMAYLFLKNDEFGGSSMFIRKLDQLKSTEIEGTQDARSFCLSPDGKWVAFQTKDNGDLIKTNLENGQSMTIASIGRFDSLDWFDETTILAAGYENRELHFVDTSASILPETTLLKLSPNQFIKSVRFLPEHQVALLGVETTEGNDRHHSIMAWKKCANQPVELGEGSQPMWILDDHGDYHIVFKQGESLRRQLVDPAILELTREQTVILGTVSSSIDIDNNGSMVYVEHQGSFVAYATLPWMNSKEAFQDVLPAGSMTSYMLSPDGTRLAYSNDYSDGVKKASSDIWIKELYTERPSTQLTPFGATFNGIVWTPDGDQLIFLSNEAENGDRYLYSVQAKFGATPRKLKGTIAENLHPLSWHLDGNKLLVQDFIDRRRGKRLLKTLTLSKTPTGKWEVTGAQNYLETSPRERGGASFSPDGKWVAYSDTDFNQNGYVFINTYPNPSTPIPISGNVVDSYLPQWNEAKQEIIYLSRVDNGSNEHSLFVVKYRTRGNQLEFDPPKL